MDSISSQKRAVRVAILSMTLVVLYGIDEWVQSAIFHNGELPVTVMSSVTAEHASNNFGLDGELLTYALVNLCLFLGYGAILRMAKRGHFSAGARKWAVVTPCVVNLLLIAVPPTASQDIYSYMAHGFLGLMPHSSPMFHAAYEVGPTLLGPKLAALGWHGRVATTPYGILWTRIEMAIMEVSQGDVATALVLFKSTVVAASLATAWMIWAVLGRLRPAAQLFGTLLYLWNPVIILEFAGEGHNDAVMIFFVVAALAACVSHRPTVSMAGTLLGVLTKYIPLLFLPAQLVYLWRTRTSIAKLALQILAAVALVVAIACVLYAPLWAGAHTFDSFLNRGQPSSSASPLGGVNFLLRHSKLESVAAPISLTLIMLPFFVFVAWLSLRVKDAADLARAFAWLAIVYAILASPDYWPWYVCMPIALIAVAEPEKLLWLVLVLSVPARFCSQLNVLYDHGYLSNIAARAPTTGLGTTLPLLLVILWAIRQRSSARSAAGGAAGVVR